MSALTGRFPGAPDNTYQGLLRLENPLSGTLQAVEDGLGTATVIQISTTTVAISSLSLTAPLPAASGGTGTAVAFANVVFAGPTSGGAIAPIFRSLVAADIPTLTSAKISDFDTQVRTSRLDQMAAPSGNVAMNSQRVTNVGTPVSSNDAVNKTYVDTLVAGLSLKPTAEVATVAPLPSCTYSNGTLGVGATLTGTANGELQIDDSATLAANSIVLVKNQVDQAENGLYIMTRQGTVSLSFILTRHPAMDTGADVVGTLVAVEDEGNVNVNTLWLCTNSNAPVMGNDDILFTQLAVGGGAVAGSDTHVQFNNSGAFGGSADFTWDNVGKVLTVNGQVLPGTDSTHSLGGASAAWAGIYSGEGIYDSGGLQRFGYIDSVTDPLSDGNITISANTITMTGDAANSCSVSVIGSSGHTSFEINSLGTARLVGASTSLWIDDANWGDHTTPTALRTFIAAGIVGFRAGKSDSAIVTAVEQSGALVVNTVGLTESEYRLGLERGRSGTDENATMLYFKSFPPGSSTGGRTFIGAIGPRNDNLNAYLPDYGLRVNGILLVRPEVLTGLPAGVEVNAFRVWTPAMQFATGAITKLAGTVISSPQYSFVGASTVTNVITAEIGGPPSPSTNATFTNSIGLRINAGNTVGVGMQVVAAASQTGDLIQTLNSGGGVTFAVEDDGALSIPVTNRASSVDYLDMKGVNGTNISYGLRLDRNQAGNNNGHGVGLYFKDVGANGSIQFVTRTFSSNTSNLEFNGQSGLHLSMPYNGGNYFYNPVQNTSEISILRIPTQIAYPGGSYARQGLFTIDQSTVAATSPVTSTELASFLISSAPVIGVNVSSTYQYCALIAAGTAAGIPLSLVAHASQTGNLFETQTSGGTRTFTINAGADIVMAPIVRTTGSPTHFLLTGAAHTALTASAESTDVNLNLARTVQFSTGALATQRAVRVQAPTYGFVAASTLTIAVTMDISGAPVQGTNATITNQIALRINAGVAAGIPLRIDAAAAQTADLLQIRDSSGTLLNNCDKDGYMFPFDMGFNLAVGSAAVVGTNLTCVIQLPRDCKLVEVMLYAKTGPTGADLICDVNYHATNDASATTVWSTQSNRARIVAGAKTGFSNTFNTSVLAKYGVLTIDLDQVGSTIAGQDITVTLSFRGREAR
jgi:hypothetical protein